MPGFGTSDPDSALAGLGFGGQRLQYELSQFIPLLVLAAVGIGFYVLGARPVVTWCRCRWRSTAPARFPRPRPGSGIGIG